MKINITSDVEEFISSLDSDTIARALHTIELLEKFGNNLELPHSKPGVKRKLEYFMHSITNQ